MKKGYLNQLITMTETFVPPIRYTEADLIFIAILAFGLGALLTAIIFVIHED
jgi:hypothetical protein